MSRKRRPPPDAVPVPADAMAEPEPPEAADEVELVGNFELKDEAAEEPLLILEPPQPFFPPESPAAKSARCRKCDARFLPSDPDRNMCDGCLKDAATRRTRVRHVLCDVMGNIVAEGLCEDGHIRQNFEAGDRAEFSREDIASLPDLLIPVES